MNLGILQWSHLGNWRSNPSPLDESRKVTLHLQNTSNVQSILIIVLLLRDTRPTLNFTAFVRRRAGWKNSPVVAIVAVKIMRVTIATVFPSCNIAARIIVARRTVATAVGRILQSYENVMCVMVVSVKSVVFLSLRCLFSIWLKKDDQSLVKKANTHDHIRKRANSLI